MTGHASRFSFAASLVLACCAAPAQAKLLPNDRVAIDSSAVTEDAVIYAGPIGAMLEPGYFRPAPLPPSRMCRWQLFFATQPFRLARACE